MTETILRLGADEVWSALEVIDPVSVLAEELIGRAVNHPDRRHPLGRLVPWTGPGHAGTDLVALEHPQAQVTCVVPAKSLLVSHAAALAALAARELLVTGGVTVAMLGTAESTQPQLAVIARHVPDISHVALCLADMEESERLAPRLIDQLELSGIGLTLVPSVADTVFGANLVVTAGDGTAPVDIGRLRSGQLARGTVLINGTGLDLPAELVDQVGQVYVDDLGLLELNRDRHVVAAHLTEADRTNDGGDGGAAAGSRWESRIAADLGQLLAGHQPGRRRADDIVLVELLGLTEPSVELAYLICRTAQRNGLGVRITN